MQPTALEVPAMLAFSDLYDAYVLDMIATMDRDTVLVFALLNFVFRFKIEAAPFTVGIAESLVRSIPVADNFGVFWRRIKASPKPLLCNC